MRSASRLGALTASGITPLLDTVFLLLFFFLAVAEVPSSRAVELVRLRLPLVEPVGAETGETGDRLLIEVDGESRVRVAAAGAGGEAGENVPSRAALDARLDAWLGGALPEETGVEIRADRDARHGVAVELLQHLRQRGFVDVQLVASGAATAEDPFGGGR